MEEIGFTGVLVGERIDTFGGAAGEEAARTVDAYGYSFLAQKPM